MAGADGIRGLGYCPLTQALVLEEWDTLCRYGKTLSASI